MGMTITQKILAKHACVDEVAAGQLIQAKVDLVMSNDATFPITVNEFNRVGFYSVFDPEKIVLVMDHFTPCKDIAAAENCRISREFAKKYGIRYFYDVGKMGIEHVLLPEKGHIAPGELIIGGDSHTCTYGALGAFATGVGSTDVCASIVSGESWFRVPSAIKILLSGQLEKYVCGKDVILELLSRIGMSGALYKSMEYSGEGLSTLSIDDRFTMANMAIECGAKNGIFEVDCKTLEYLKDRVDRKFDIYTADADVVYDEVLKVDLSKTVPMVSLPHLPSNAVPISEIPETRINQVFIGSCTNGRLSDLATVAEILKGNKVSDNVRVIIVPGTQDIYRQAMQLGYLETFIDAGCAISTPTCGACGGGHMGLLGKDEVVLSTSNRNFKGRMGHIDSLIYLSSPMTAAASALTGIITAPDKL